jgi:hypothetical protein
MEIITGLITYVMVLYVYINKSLASSKLIFSNSYENKIKKLEE